MKLNLTPKFVYGNLQYVDLENRIVASKIGNMWYPTLETCVFDAGFTNIACMTKILENLEYYEEELKMLGYHRLGSVFVNTADPTFISEARIETDGRFAIEAFVNGNRPGYRREYQYTTDDFETLKKYISDLIVKYDVDIFSSIMIVPHDKVQYVIEAKMSTRDLAKNLVRVKSSNVWAYGINIKDRKDKTGDVLVQFKDKDGGAGDLYLYYDVPVAQVWRKILSAPSKGHAVWQYLRNKFKYSKLTGDKRGKLPNAVN